MLAMGLLAGSVGGLWVQLGAIIAAGAGVYLLVQRRRLGGPRPTTIPLTAHHALHVVETGDIRIVVGTGPGAAPRLLYELPPRQGPSSGTQATSTQATPDSARATATRLAAQRPSWDRVHADT